MIVARSFSSSLSVLSLVVVVVAGCSPLGGVGDSCESAPCASGLLCEGGVCSEPPPPPPPPPPPCESAEDCAVFGVSDGRACVEGECVDASCFTDAQCGFRVCIDGTCADRELCFNDDGCDDGAVCVDNACRPPCFADEDCGPAIGGISLQTCVDGECLQRCLNDATCFGGGLCEDGICIAVECSDDDDCDGTNEVCTAGRCEAYTPCAADGDCFDPNLRCDVDVEPARCVERPACFNDAACGFDSLCLANHCRPATGCFVDDDCDVGDECVGGRCVDAPTCRAAADCNPAQTCVNLRCVDAVDEAADDFLVADDAGSCVDTCARTLLVGESMAFRFQGLFEGAPVFALPVVDNDDLDVVATGITDARVIIDGLDVGETAVTMGAHRAEITVVDAAGPDELVVLVTDAVGTPVAGAEVTIAAVDRTITSSFVTDSAGVVRTRTFTSVGEIVARSGGRGTAIVFADDDDVVRHGWRLLLPGIEVPGAPLAAATLTVTSTGDELGPVGLGLAVPSVSSPSAVSLAALLGDDVTSSLTVPVIGTLPVTVPSALSVSAALPLLGEQVLRDRSEIVVAAGPAWALAIEGRRENDTLTSLALGGDLRAFALELFEQSETLDVELVSLGSIAAVPVVNDTTDRDGDGNTTEPVADFASAPRFAVTPSQPPTERGSVVVHTAGVDVDDAVIVAGFDLPGRVVVAGVGVARGLTNFEGVPLAESFKASPAPLALARASRIIVVAGDFADASLSSRLIFKGRRVLASTDLGALLAPPEGAFVVDDLPGAGVRTALLPASNEGIDLTRLRFVDGADVIDVWAGAGGSVRLPASLAAARLVTATVLRTGGVSALQASAGARLLDDSAAALASAPAGR